MATTEPAESADIVQPAEPAQYPHHRRRRRIALAVVAFLFVGVALVGLDAARSARTMLTGIKGARNALDAGAESVVVGDPDGAQPQLREAAARADEAVAASNRVSVKLLALLPVVGPNVRTTRAVATAIGDSARAGLTMADADKLLTWDNIQIPGAKSVGNVDLAKIQAATPKVDSVARQLQDALGRLQGAGGGRLIGAVASGYRDALVTLQRRVALANNLRDVFHLLPGMLGGQGRKRYLVAVQSLGIPRATGGLISSTGVLTAQAGRLTLGRLRPASRAMAATNVSPDLPTDAPVMLKVAKAAGLGTLDGVILTDSVGLEDMLWMVGRVSPADLHNPLTMDSGAEVLERRIFLGTDGARAASTHAGVSGAVLDGFLARRPSMEAFAIGMADAISQRHLAMWTTASDIQRSLSDLGATGGFDPKAGSVMVVWRGTSPNRAASYVRRTTVQVVRLSADGVAVIKTEVGIDNHAPKGPRSLLLGTRGAVGTWSADASIYLPKASDNASGSTSDGGPTHEGQDLGATVVTGSLTAAPGHQASMTVGYRQRKAAEQEGSLWRYQLVVLPQAALTPMPVRIRIKLPEGMSLVSKANRLTLVSDMLSYQGSPSAALTLWVTYR